MSDLDSDNLLREKKKVKADDRAPMTVNQTKDASQFHSVTENNSHKKKKNTIKYAIIGGSILVAAILIIVLSVTLTKEEEIERKDIPLPPSPPPVPIIAVSPFAYQEFNNFKIESSPSSGDFNVSTILSLQVQPIQSNLQETQPEAESVGGIFDGHDYQPVNPRDIVDGANNKWASRVKLDFALIDNYQAQLNITNLDIPNQYEVSPEAFTRPVLSHEARFTQVGFQQAPVGQPYYFNFSDIYQNETLISTYKRKFHITEKFSEIGFVVPTKKIFGLGQRNSQLLLKNGTYSLWAQGRKEGLPTEQSEGGQNGPHIHPFVLCQTKTNDFFGIFFAASSAQTFEVIYYPGYSETVLNYIQLGGKMEIYFMMRGTAQEIIQRYHALIGYSMVPPYYALGFFQGSNAYTNIDQIHKVVAGYKSANMALEGILIDNYYAGPSQVFTVNPVNYGDLAALESQLTATNQHMILGIQTGISNSANYKYYNNLINNKCYIVSQLTQKPLVGLVNGTVVYPDYTCADLNDFLTDALMALDDLTSFEGVYLQNNMLYNLANGEYKTAQQMEQYASIHLQQEVQINEETSGNWNQSYKINKDQSKISTYNLPFLPGYFWSGNLDNQTVSLNSTHSGNVQDLYVHNINGHLSSKTYFNILNSSTTWSHATKRPLIFSDSTWAGSGKYAAIALHDMRREWSNLKTTIAQVMAFSMYGIQNVVADICGNLGPVTDEELCGRWAQLSAFLPMTRSYYNMTYWDFTTSSTQNGSQSELYNIKDYQYQFMSSAALNQRMQYSRYIYSQMYKVYREGGALVYPLLFDYPADENLLDWMEETYMLGDAIKVSPVLGPGVTGKFGSYFPAGSWADLNQYNVTVQSKGEEVPLDSSEAYTSIHLKAGKIIPFQLNSQQVKTTQELMTKVPISFIVHRDDSQYAEGFTLVDDGISSGTWDNVDYTFWKLRYASKSINFWVNYGDFKYSPPEGYTIDSLDSIHILNAQDLANTNFACFLGLNLNPINMTYSYNPYNYVLTLRPATGTTVKFNEIGFIKFGNNQHEPNFCDYSSAFTYEQAGQPIKIDQVSMDIPIRSLQGTKHLEELVFSVRLLDDQGTINVNITTLSDYYDNTIKFKIPYVTDFTYFKAPTKTLDQFFDFKASPFSYRIFKEGDSDTTLYQSDPHKLYFDQYLVFDSAIFSMNPLTNYPLMGMGERAGDLFYSNEQGGIHSRYSFDQANPIDDGLPPGRNMYGVQPFYVYQSVSTDWVGVFDLNSYATDYVLYFNEGTNTQITKIVIGGTIQKYFFVGDKPDAIITTYSGFVGRQTVPPLWAFGWQQCRFGWKTDEDWYSVLQNYKTFDLPLDTMWADIDYMDDYKIFTISESRYANLASNVTEIRKNNMTFVPIMDVGVAVRPNNGYFAYDQGIEQDIFIKIYNGSSPLTAGVWPGHAYFPDFWHPNADTFWHASFDYLKNNYGLEFDGIWIDMNEATNFCNGYCVTGERPTDSLRNKPYYVPGWRDLEDKALGVDGLHANGWREYDLHSTYSLLQVRSTANYLIKQGKRPYVLSRSNFPGLAEYGYHWMGDNWSTVDYMRYSVDGMYSYQLFGLPFSGSDICGFDGDAPADLCTRWHQLGSLYPFSRNHNQNATAAQEPYRFNHPYPKDPTITYTDIIKSALVNRYSYIRYYYSHFYDIGQYGGSFFKPLFFEFTADPLAYKNIQQNMLLGEALKLSIEITTLAEGTTDFYFPEGAWCQIYPYVANCFTSPAAGSTFTMRTYLTDYYIHVREGFIVPYQNATEKKVHNTKALLDVPMDLYLLPSNANKAMSTHTTPSVQAAAIGYIYFDDGVSFEDKSTRFDLIFSIPQAKQGKLQVRQVSSGYPRQSVYEQQLYRIHILYATHSQLSGVSQASYDTISQTGSFKNLAAPVYDKDTDTLTIEVAASFYDVNTVVFS